MWHDGIIFKLKQNGISDNFSDVSFIFFSEIESKEKSLKGKSLFWMTLTHEFPKVSHLAHFSYIQHDLTDDLSNIKLFYTPLCSVVYNVNTLTDEVNNDLVKINKWTYQLKMSFNPDPIKQAHVLYTGKISKKDHPHWFLNNNVSEANSQKS